jgi:hypothetical protein
VVLIFRLLGDGEFKLASPDAASPEIAKASSLDAIEDPKTLSQEEKILRIPSTVREWLAIFDLKVCFAWRLIV